ncbi:hypothetical protein J7J47_09430 [Halomonas sp. ISL-60]|uniref:hypothetical protein n=1 Tax=Halomonas sp. ISL-56 TaxID=2819149 RepID=UPI001BECAA34|nr:hypothetical protein [Halomonas sp. ISL-56]MBT2772454.1 hypothetical protein [Halomonas sp. ISL-60]MBT2803365.1 hypothetical protein [Halomonas sp. ISL-56]
MEIELSPLLSKAIRTLAAKRTMLKREKDIIETIAVGSSHGDFGFDPRYCENSFNLCYRSLDLKHSFGLYSYACNTLPNLKNVIVFYSVFSSGFSLERSNGEKEISVAVNELFELDFTYDDEVLVESANMIKGHFDDYEVEANGIRGFLATGKGFLSESIGVDVRSSAHMKHNSRKDFNLYLAKIISLSQKMGHKVFVVIPPVRSDYRKAVGKDFENIFSGLLELKNEFHLDYDFPIINFYSDDGFVDSYFGDFDHLMPSGDGARLLSLVIGNVLKGDG